MKKIKILLLLMILLFSMPFQAQTFELRIVNENETPIDGAYVLIGDKVFAYSNSEGIVAVLDKDYSSNDSISFSHLAYQPIKYSLSDLKKASSFPYIFMKSNIIELMEIVVSNINEKKYVKEAIDLIPKNYGLAFKSNTYLNASIVLRNDGDSTLLINYKGGLILSLDSKKKLTVSKIPDEESVVDNLKDYIFQVKPYNFTSIIGITSHPVIRKFKDFKFTKHEFLKYKGVDAIKIYFELDRKHGGQSGSMIIDKNNKAIISLSYTINPIKEWIVAKTKRGVEKVSLINYYVEADYVADEKGLYLFDSGREKIVLHNSAGKYKINTTSEVYLKRIDKQVKPKDQVGLNHIF